MRKFRLFFKILISILSIGCLVYIFVIDDHVKLFERYNTEATDIDDISEDYTVTINAPSSILYYQDTPDFNFLQDVTAVDSDGKDLTGELKYAIKAGSSLSEKKIEYFITHNGTTIASAERAFVIENYTGPVINITPDVTIHATEASDLLAKLKELGAISANDGLGNDITSTVEYNSDSALNTAGTYPVKFVVTNFFNDTFSLIYNLGIVGSTTDPVVGLTTTSVTLPLGSEFNWINYFDYATDPVEGDISHRVYVKDNINPLVPGVYKATYKATNSQGVSSEPVELTVIISAE